MSLKSYEKMLIYSLWRFSGKLSNQEVRTLMPVSLVKNLMDLKCAQKFTKRLLFNSIKKVIFLLSVSNDFDPILGKRTNFFLCYDTDPRKFGQKNLFTEKILFCFFSFWEEFYVKHQGFWTPTYIVLTGPDLSHINLTIFFMKEKCDNKPSYAHDKNCQGSWFISILLNSFKHWHAIMI